MQALFYHEHIVTAQTLISIAAQNDISLDDDVAERWLGEAITAVRTHVCSENSAVEHLFDKVFGGEGLPKIVMINLQVELDKISLSTRSIIEAIKQR
jgi:hypothetical protein